MKKHPFLAVGFFFFVAIVGSNAPSLYAQNTAAHAKWDALLQKNVTAAGVVNYAGMKQDKAKLNQYLDELAAAAPSANTPRAAAVAYWINAYNAHTVSLIVNNYPVQSIKGLDDGNPWDVKRIKIDGKVYSLNQIEKDILIKQYKENRVHFAVNCAAKSCPPLLNTAWTAENLETNLEKQTNKFINNPAFNQIMAGTPKISQIFEWYESDFGNVITFLNKYSKTKISPKAKIAYIPYDWKLNGK